MKWYLSNIVYQIVCGNGTHTPQFDEQLRLIIACNEEEALLKARFIGKKEEDVFYNAEQQLVRWQFLAVSELYALHESMDGAEVFSRIREVDDAAGYSSFLKHKADNLNLHNFQPA